MEEMPATGIQTNKGLSPTSAQTQKSLSNINNSLVFFLSDSYPPFKCK